MLRQGAAAVGLGGAGTWDQGGSWAGRRGAGSPAAIGGPQGWGGARPLHDLPQRPSPGWNHRHFLPVLRLPFITPSAGNPRGEGMTGCRLRAPSGFSCPAMPGLSGAAGPPGVCSVRVWRGHPDTQPTCLEAPLTSRGILDLKAGHGRGGRGGRRPSW